MFKLNDRIGALAAEMVTLGASTRFNTLQETARLAQMRETLASEDSDSATAKLNHERKDDHASV